LSVPTGQTTDISLDVINRLGHSEPHTVTLHVKAVPAQGQSVYPAAKLPVTVR
jgi:hypothetical protein